MMIKLPHKKSFVLTGLLCASLTAGAFAVLANKGSDRVLEFTETLRITPQDEKSEIKVWFPVAINSKTQAAEVLDVKAPWSHKTTIEKEFGNKTLFFKGKTSKDKEIELVLRTKINRDERKGLEAESQESLSDADATAYLSPKGLEVINDEIRKKAAEATKGINEPIKKAEAIYKYVLSNMKYDKTGEGWGRGDSVYACDVGKGNCTDFHSLFITMARASDIPARFQMGIPLPETKEGKPSGGYHCWAEFFIEGKGWIPVDISEAWKNPEKAEYFFGNLDAHRILLSTGREIVLSPRQAGAPLNYFSKPYVEIDGKPYYDFKLERRFKDVTPNNKGDKKS